MIKNCKVCQKEFITYPSKLKIGRGKYCSKKCCLSITNRILEENGKETRFKKGQEAHNFKGFTYTRGRVNGKIYKLIFKPEHPFCDRYGYIRAHRSIMEKHLKRYLNKDEIVHHKNEDTLDNRIKNLIVVSDKEHRIIHLKDNVHKRWMQVPVSS